MVQWRNQVFCEDALQGLARLPDASIDLLLADPPYGLGKDYGNDSDKLEAAAYLDWMTQWIDMALPKLKANGSLYIFLTWRYSPEVFVMLKQRMSMMNEIIWDRRVPSMGGSVRKYSSVHDTIGFFVKAKDYYFDLDAIRIPYDAATKKARSRKIFEGALRGSVEAAELFADHIRRKAAPGSDAGGDSRRGRAYSDCREQIAR